MKRQTVLFNVAVITFLTVVVELFLTGCSVPNENSQTSTPANCLSKGAVTVVGSNHGHSSTTIPATDVLTATQKQYTVGDAGIGHTHTFTVAAANFTTLQANTSVVINTDPDGALAHTHQITINCL